MLSLSSRKSVIGSFALILGLLASACSGSNPAAPSNFSPVTTATSAAAPTASVSQVLPASLPPSPVPQTLFVEGENFKPGLIVDLTFTPSSTASIGQRSTRAVTTSASGVEIHNLTETSFEVNVTVTEPGTYRLRVTNPESSPSAPVIVAAEPPVTSRPIVAGISPSSPSQSTAPKSIYVLGNNFEEGLFVQLTAPSSAITVVSGESIDFGSATAFRMKAALPEVGIYRLRAINPSGATSEPWSFTVKAAETPAPPTPENPTTGAPTITGLTPQSPTTNDASQTVTVVGTNFAAGLTVLLKEPGEDGAETIAGSSISDLTATSFKFAAKLEDAGGYSLRVVNPSGQTSAPWTFAVKTPEGGSTPPAGPPVITSMEPATPTASTATQPLYIVGTNLQPGLTVLLTRPNSETITIPASSITFPSPTVARVMVVLPTTGGHRLRIVNPSGEKSEWREFTVNPAEAPVTPAVTGLLSSPLMAKADAQPVYFSGTGFQAGMIVKLSRPNGETSTITAVQVPYSTAFKITVTLGAPGAYSVRVINPSELTSTPFSFDVAAGS